MENNKISRREAIKKIGGLAMLTLTPFGCTTRPYIKDGGKQYNITNDFDLEKVTENASKYQVKGLEIFGEQYFVVNTDLGNAMFKREKSIIEITNFNNSKNRKTSIQSGEGGLYFIKPVKTNKGYADWVKIKSSTKKADITNPRIIKRINGLGIFHTTEKNSQFNMPVIEIHQTPYFAVKVEDKEMNKKGFYNFYLIPDDKSAKTRINQNGEIRIVNQDKILRPQFKCWQQIDEMLLKLKPSTKADFKNLKAKEIGIDAITYRVKKEDTLFSIARKNNTTVKRLMRLNPRIKNRNLIYPNQNIILRR